MNTNQPMSTSLFAHGIQGIDTHYTTERLLIDAETRRTLDTLRASGTAIGVRHALGGMMIALGAAIAGKTHDLQERQATMPSPSAKSGFVPTR